EVGNRVPQSAGADLPSRPIQATGGLRGAAEGTAEVASATQCVNRVAVGPVVDVAAVQRGLPLGVPVMRDARFHVPHLGQLKAAAGAENVIEVSINQAALAERAAIALAVESAAAEHAACRVRAVTARTFAVVGADREQIALAEHRQVDRHA